MAELQGQEGEVKMTIHITRAATGKVDTYDLVGKIIGIEEGEEPNDIENTNEE